MTGDRAEPDKLGTRLAEKLINMGALELLEHSRAEAEIVPESVI
jgi:hypothetical protein